VRFLTFICVGCGNGQHVECNERNKGKHTPDCDCQHVYRRADSFDGPTKP
jgi:hypothetical protein